MRWKIHILDNLYSTVNINVFFEHIREKFGKEDNYKQEDI